ncbi:DUF1622 domain-containing protein [Erythrobacter sp. SDW2]|uniref:DUF1622 domain-containing protein n=1 Tax=Erythrobacter sp. SDW2 TaxID=2907154 RepID=UPI001F250227|nr:DUF1622 domain-containing protein [Erythrobacter sp. SDW2]UIP06425.1 DUF1622 domain-containing protein [Erythrobacter sp. SDW2]
MFEDDFLRALSGTVSQLFEITGIAVIVIGTLIAIGMFALSVPQREAREGHGPDPVTGFRRNLGRSILVGLELLVAADIIRTVAVDPSMQSVLVLGLIVLIRTFLSFSLEVEINGRWPWQKKEPAGK